MTTEAPELLIEVDGRPATESDLRMRALNNYGHFTAMQVRGGGVRGVDLHAARLDAASRELFGVGLPAERVRALLRHALGDVQDASARVYVHQADPAERPSELSLMVTVRPPATPDDRAVSLMSVAYERPAAHLKHLGGFGQIYHRHRAARAGFDDALLTGPGGVVLEGSIANVGFWDGGSVVWPQGAILTGTTMALVEPRLAAAGLASVRREVTLPELAGFRAAFHTNSQGVVAVSRIDDVEFPGDAELLARVRGVYESVEWERP